MGIYKPGGDIRGIYPKEVNEKLFHKIGITLGKRLIDKKIVIGGDPRPSTNILKKSLIKGLRIYPLKIIDIGMVSTPALFFAQKFYNANGALMVTASHNPIEYNGLKIYLDGHLTNKRLNEIKKEIDSISDFTFNGRELKGHYSKKEDFTNIYQRYILDLLPTSPISNLKVVIDCGNGSCSKIAPNIFKAKNYKVKEINCETKGSFSRGPNPADPKNLTDLQSSVVKFNADLGVAYDCDGDRVAFVDDKGRIVNNDKSFSILINNFPDVTGEKIVYDAKSSQLVPEIIKQNGAIPIMERTGRLFIQKTMKENNAILAGENSGHFFFRSLGRDDGIYSSVIMADFLSSKKASFSKLIDELPKYETTNDIRIDYFKDRDELLNKIERNFDDYKISKVDGLKVYFNSSGWGLIRKSITEPCVTLRFEAISKEELNCIINKFTKVLPEIEDSIFEKLDTESNHKNYLEA